MRIAPLVLASLLAVACSSKKSQDGLPPAQDWGSGQPGGQMQAQQPSAKVNPHVAEDQALPPGHPPMDNQLPPGHPPMEGSGGAPSGPDVTQMGFSAPDPTRKVDPTKRIRGTIKVDAKAKANVKAGGAIFLIVKKADANGQPSGPPLAVDKVLYADGLKFELTEANAMVAGTELTGDVVVSARYDQDSDAISKQPGDVTGMTKVKIPAENVELKLDTVLP
jgi:hypothetical protein